MKKVICIVGPTASGKTSLSVELALRIGAEIINADSVSLYKKLDIGSAKITKEEMQNIPHHLIDHVDLDTEYTVYNFQQDVRNLLKQINIPVMVGGSGLYVQSALYDYAFESQKDIQYPSKEKMVQFILKNDPEIDLDFNNIRRIESAYRTIVSGRLRSEKTNKNEPLYDIYLVYLDVDRSILRQRVENRLKIMIEKGFIEEVKSLIGYDLNIIGYREIQNYLKGNDTLEGAKQKIVTATMRFAKRQKTWFLNQMQPHIYDALDPNLLETVTKDVKKFLGDI